MHWIRILLIVLVAIFVVIGGAVAFLVKLDPNDYKENISAMAERWTGRTLALDGRIDLDIGMQTSLELTDASLSNPDWAAHPNMAKLARAKVVLDIRSLLDGPIIVESIELDDAALHLESLEDGRNNWTFGGSDGSGTGPESDDSAEGESDSGGIIPLVLRHVQAQGFLFTLTMPALPQPLEIRVDRLTQNQTEDGLLDATVTGTLNGRNIAVSGKYGPLGNLLTATDLRFDVQGDFDTLSIRSSGLIDDLASPRLPDIELSVSGPAIDDVTEMLGIPDLGDGGLNLAASVKPDADGIAANVKGNIGEYVTDTSARANELLAVEHFSMKTSIHGPDLGSTMRIFGVENVPGGPFELTGSIARDASNIEIDSARLNIGSTVVNVNGTASDFRNLKDANLKLQIAGNNVEQFRELIGIPGAATGPFRIDADLNVRQDGAELLDVIMQTNIARLKITGALVGTAPDFVGTTLRFDGAGNNLANFTEVYEIPNVIAGPFSIKGAIELGDQKLSTTDAVNVAVGDASVSLEGTMGYQPLERDTDIRVHATGQNLARFAAMAGVTEFIPAVGYDISTGLRVGADGYQVRGLDATLGRSRVTFDGLISKAADFTGTRATFSASGPQFNELVADTGSLDFADGPFDVSGSAELLADAVRLRKIRAEVAGAEATLDADVSLPLESASGRFDLAASGPNLRAVLPTRPRWQPPEAPFEIRAKGKLADGMWTFDELAAQLADARLTGSGAFDQPPDLSRTKLAISMQIPNLGALGAIDERGLPATNVNFDVNFAGSPDSYTIDPFKAVIGKGDLAGSLTAKLDGDVPEVELRLLSNFLNLDTLLQADQKLTGEVDELEQQASGADSKPADGRLIPDRQLPLEPLKKLNARFDIDARTVLFRGRKNTDVALDGVLRNGRLNVEKAMAVTPDGKVAATLNLVPTADSADLKVTFDGAGIYVGIGELRSAEDIEKSPRFDVKIDLAGSGLTVRQVAADLNGQVEIMTHNGRVPNAGLNFLFGGFFEELLSAVNPFIKKDPYTDISCAVLLLDVEDGLVTVDPGLVVQTGKLIIAAKGMLSLATEKIDIDFKTAPRSRVSVSAGEFINPYLKVAGTMNAPKLTINPTGAIVTGGAAVATAGISLLATAVWDRVFRADDPCAAALAEAQKDGDKKKKFLGIF